MCLLVVSLFLASETAIACSCAPYPADEAQAVALAYGRADAIFLGVVTAVRPGRLQALFVRDATFDVMASWKGLNGDDATVVRSAHGEIACGFKFRRKSRYLVFAHLENGRLWTNICELTRSEAEAQGLIKALDDLKKREAANSEGKNRDASRP